MGIRSEEEIHLDNIYVKQNIDFALKEIEASERTINTMQNIINMNMEIIKNMQAICDHEYVFRKTISDVPYDLDVCIYCGDEMIRIK